MADSAFWDKVADKYARKPVKDVDSYHTSLDLTRKHLSPRLRPRACQVKAEHLAMAYSLAGGHRHNVRVRRRVGGLPRWVFPFSTTNPKARLQNFLKMGLKKAFKI